MAIVGAGETARQHSTFAQKKQTRTMFGHKMSSSKLLLEHFKYKQKQVAAAKLASEQCANLFEPWKLFLTCQA